MLNNTVLVGRTISIDYKETKNGTKVATLQLEIPRSYKNKDGGYDNDYISCVLFNALAENTNSYIKAQDIVGVKGRLSCEELGKDLQLIAERVTFLSARKSEA